MVWRLLNALKTPKLLGMVYPNYPVSCFLIVCPRLAYLPSKLPKL